VFYTTSPFEAARRRAAFAASPTLDVTPSFASDNPFGGVALFRAATALPRHLTFIQSMEVAPKVKIPSLRSQVERYTSNVKRGEAPSEPKYVSLTREEYTRIRNLPVQLDDSLAAQLSIEMERARLLSDEDAKDLLRRLVTELKDQDPPQAVRNVIMLRYPASGPASARIYDAITQARNSGRMGLRRRGPFLNYVQDAGNWAEDVTEGLRQAEDLGLLKWSFLHLSSGQVAMLMLFASLAGALEQLASRHIHSVVLTVDEGEMFMHPEWQRTYLSHLTGFLQHYRSRFNAIHLVLSTHSLILAGDAPPNRLFDVQHGRMNNGFAAAPDELLKTVYHVDEFAGELAATQYSRIASYLREDGTPEMALEVLALVQQIASKRLRKYLVEEITRRIETYYAQA
jgi:hypothetical protein